MIHALGLQRLRRDYRFQLFDFLALQLHVTGQHFKVASHAPRET